jgi:hypothetical protein
MSSAGNYLFLLNFLDKFAKKTTNSAFWEGEKSRGFAVT